MARTVKGDMWRQHHTLYLITSSSVITPSGLVMSSGIARQAVELHGPEVRRIAANRIQETDDPSTYGLQLLAPELPALALFQTRHHHQEPHDFQLIRISTAQLIEYANRNPEVSIALPTHDLENADFLLPDLKRILKHLPDNVAIYRPEK